MLILKKKFSEKTTYLEFADHYKWYFVQECQLGNISNKECNNKWAALEVVAKKIGPDQVKTYAGWKEYFNKVSLELESWMFNESVGLVENFWRNFNNGNSTITISKKDLAQIIEAAYQEGKSKRR